MLFLIGCIWLVPPASAPPPKRTHASPQAQSESAAALAAPDSLERQFAALEGDGGVEAELQVQYRY